MNVKGTALIARKQTVEAEFGEEAWQAFFAKIVETDPMLDGVLPITSIPVASFLAFSDALVEAFYRGDQKVHWRFGEDSAEWALTNGPYAHFRVSRDVPAFLRATPMLWKAYYSEGSFEASMDPEGKYVRAHIECPVRHLHFEYSVMGFTARALKLVGVKARSHYVERGFAQRDRDVLYRFRL